LIECHTSKIWLTAEDSFSVGADTAICRI
jgi:hypothetical protein